MQPANINPYKTPAKTASENAKVLGCIYICYH